jgi:hypothetical protein
MCTPPFPGPRACDDQSLAALLRSREPVIIESHFSGWNEPWRALAPDDWRRLHDELGAGLGCALVDTGTNREFAVRHGLEILPEVLVLLAGDVVARFHGRVDVQDLVHAVRAARDAERSRNEALQELEVTTSGAGASKRSLFRRRGTSPTALAQAG